MHFVYLCPLLCSNVALEPGAPLQPKLSFRLPAILSPSLLVCSPATCLSTPQPLPEAFQHSNLAENHSLSGEFFSEVSTRNEVANGRINMRINATGEGTNSVSHSEYIMCARNMLLFLNYHNILKLLYIFNGVW